MASLTVQFLGRFAYLHSMPKHRPKRLKVIATDIAFNQLLGLNRHTPRLVIARSLLKRGRGAEFGTAVFSVTKVGGFPEEFVAWDLAGYDVTFVGLTPTKGVTITEIVPMPDIVKIGKGPIKPSVIARTPLEAPVAARFNIDSGVLVSDQQPPQTTFTFLTEAGRPGGMPTDAEPLADMAIWTAKCGSWFEIHLRRFTDSDTKTIYVQGTQTSSFACAVTHTCVHSRAENGDVEFSAYYELLDNKILETDRLIPTPTVTSGDDSARCYNVCQAPCEI
jgi:hypothetical protein